MNLALLTVALAATPEAPAAGCDVDSHVGVICTRNAVSAIELELLLFGVGSARELRQRVARVRAVSATVEGERSGTVTFDGRGRFVTWSGRGGTSSFEWDDKDGLLRRVKTSEDVTFTGTATACSAQTKGWVASCVQQGSQLVHTHPDLYGKATRDEYQVDEHGLAPAPGNPNGYAFERDAKGLLSRWGPTSYRRAATETRGGADGEDVVWTLDAVGLPVRYRDSSSDLKVTWKRSTLVQIVDGTCPGKKPCSNPELEAVAGALKQKEAALELVVERGDPPRNARTATEIWFQSSGRLRAQQLREVLKVAPEQVREWTWGGPFDVLVIVGPPRR